MYAFMAVPRDQTVDTTDKYYISGCLTPNSIKPNYYCKWNQGIIYIRILR